MNIDREGISSSLEPHWSLKTVALTAMISAMWQEIQFHEMYHCYDPTFRMEIIEEAYRRLKIESMGYQKLNPSLMKELREMIVQTLPDVYDWLQYCGTKMNRYVCPVLLWTPNGLLDVERMIQAWLRFPHDLNRELRFQVACDFCIEEKVEAMYRASSREWLDGLCQGFVGGINLLEYWMRRLDPYIPLEPCCTLERWALNNLIFFKIPLWLNGVTNVPAIKYLVKRTFNRECQHNRVFFTYVFKVYLRELLENINPGVQMYIVVIPSSLIYFLSQMIYPPKRDSVEKRCLGLDEILLAIFFNRLWKPKTLFWWHYAKYIQTMGLNILTFGFFIDYAHHIKQCERYIEESDEFDNHEEWKRYSRIIIDWFIEFPEHRRVMGMTRRNWSEYLFDALRTERKRSGPSLEHLEKSGLF